MLGSWASLTTLVMYAVAALVIRLAVKEYTASLRRECCPCSRVTLLCLMLLYHAYPIKSNDRM